MTKSIAIRLFLVLVATSIAIYGLVTYPNKIFTDNLGGEQPSKIIVKLCHVDTFEGGTGSRKQFILRVARKFEAENKNVLISVTSMNKEAYYSKKETYDLISYGIGVKVENSLPITTDNYYPSGVVDGKVYALPWAIGGYYILSRKPIDDVKNIEDAVVSESDYSSPFLALALSGYCLKNYVTKSPIDAYTDFITRQKDVLIGTQRDINRVNARGESCVVTPLNGFSDLIQYVSVTSSDNESSVYAQKFANYLVGDGQSFLSSVGMFSPFKSGLYADGLLHEGEKILINATYHAFMDGDLSREINNAYKNFSKIDENKNQIKKLLVYLDKNYRI